MPAHSIEDAIRIPHPGFTLAEFLIAATVLAITLTVAVPSFVRLHRGNAMTSQVNHLVAHLNLARSAAVTRRTLVALCPSHNGAVCLADPDWHRGWVVFVDGNGNRELDGGEEVLRTVSRAKGELTMTTAVSRRRIVYQPSGSPRASNATFTLCDPDGLVAPRAVILSNTGRARVSERRADGSPIAC